MGRMPHRQESFGSMNPNAPATKQSAGMPRVKYIPESQASYRPEAAAIAAQTSIPARSAVPYSKRTFIRRRYVEDGHPSRISNLGDSIPRSACSGSAPFSGGIYAPDAGAVSRDIQEHEAVQGRQLPHVLNREERLRAMRHPIREGHQPTTQKSRPSREESDHHEGSTDQFDRSSEWNDE